MTASDLLIWGLVQRMPIACRVAQAYAANMETMTMLKEHHSDDWHAAIRGWIVLAFLLAALVVVASVA
jgi:hypothetical protein